MTKFIDGPVAGKVLALRRAPFFLRVVQSITHGEIDALDQVDDQPRPSESIFVYRQTKNSGGAFICTRGSKAGRNASGYFPLVEYCMNPMQPCDEVLRDNGKWQEWCLSQPEAKPAPVTTAFKGINEQPPQSRGVSK